MEEAEATNAPKMETNHQIESSKPEVSILWRNMYVEAGRCSLSLCHTHQSPDQSSTKVILDRVDGHFDRHTLNAVMGPSGAGKTTLLRCLSGNQSNHGNWDIRVHRTDTTHTGSVGWVEQHVHQTVLGALTVGELLRYAYRFKNTGDCGGMNGHIADTLQQLLLDHSICGRRFDQCSGGEQKRVTIAQELMCGNRRPRWLFVDEPTTGLDSAAAQLVVQCLKRLTTTGLTVVVSIHYPNAEVLPLFDRLYVLAKEGRCVYSGPPHRLGAFLSTELHTDSTTSAHQPPIEKLLKIACNGSDDPCVLRLANRTRLEEHQSVKMHSMTSLTAQPFGLCTTRKRFHLADLWVQTGRLLRVSFVAEHRLLIHQLLDYFGTLLLLVSVYNPKMVEPSGCVSMGHNSTTTCQAGLDRDTLLTENQNYLHFMLMFFGFFTACTSAVLYAPLVKVIRSEHRNQWYSVGVFYWSSAVVSVAQLTLVAVTFATLGYILSGQQTADGGALNWGRLGHFVAVVWLTGVFAQSFGQLMGALVLDCAEVAIVLSQMGYTFMIMLNDFFFRVDEMGSSVMIVLSNLTSLKFLTHYLLYVFYGLDRCDPVMEYSLVLEKFEVQPNRIEEYIVRVLLNVAIFRLITLAVLYYRFNSFADTWLVRLWSGYRRKLFESTKKPYDASKRVSIASSVASQKALSIVANYQIDLQTKNHAVFRHIILAWRNLSLYGSSSIYEVGVVTNNRTATEPHVILRELNGELLEGTLTGLMGTSGSGKTSLLTVLNGGHQTRLSEHSQFYLSAHTKLHTCFIAQEVSGHLLPGLTAKQTLLYASRLKNSHLYTQTIDHEQMAMNLLAELDLLGTVDTKVDRCSGGERKRLALAAELTALEMPNLVCIDEPTSGLDSNSAEIVINCLQQITRRHNLTIVASIHQPNSDLLAKFDQLYVLARGGVCVFSGPPITISTHLATAGLTVEPSQVPIETLIKHSCAGVDDPTVKRLVNSVPFTKTTELIKQTLPVADGVQPNRTRFSLASVAILMRRYLLYIYGHLWSEWLLYTGLYLGYGLSMRNMFDPSIATATGCLNLEDDFNATACNRSESALLESHLLETNFKYNFFVNNMFQFIILVQTTLNFGRELAQFHNEHRNGWYSAGVFYAMKSLLDTAFIVPIILVYVWICDIYSAILVESIYWPLVATFTLCAVGFQAMSHISCIVFPNNLVGRLIMSLGVYFLFSLLGNFFVSLERLHYAYQALSNLSIARFTFQTVMLLEYGFGRCGPNQIQSVLYTLAIDDSMYEHGFVMLVFNLVLARLVATVLFVVRCSPVENRRRRVHRILTHNQQLRPSKAIIIGLDCAT